MLSGLNSNGDANTKVYINEQEILGVNGFAEKIELSIHPNPITDKQLNLVYDVTTLTHSVSKITIYSTLGQKVYQTQLKNDSGFSNKSLDLSSLSIGVYVLQFTSGKFTPTKKIILE